MRYIALTVILAAALLACGKSEEAQAQQQANDDAATLKRLRMNQATACIEVLRRDSLQMALEAAVRRINSGSTTDLAQAKADVAEITRRRTALGAKIALGERDPKALDALEGAEYDERIKCDLTTRDLNKFMNGRL